MKNLYLTAIALFLSFGISAQSVPGDDTNIPALVTFGLDGDKSWGDDDFIQTFFLVIPEGYKDMFYIRVYDPACAGELDEIKGGFNTITQFSIYGGIGCISDDDSKFDFKTGKGWTGNLLKKKVFHYSDDKWDEKWYSFGPFNPTSGENMPQYGGYVFKIICEGVSGDDGNLYKYFLSTESDKNIAVEGSESFTYEYTFRMHNDPREVSHLYPYLDERVISVRQGNFDWDSDGELLFVSKKRHAVHMDRSPDKDWAISEHKVIDGETKGSLDVQFHKNHKNPTRNNNVVFFITNQYGEHMPFYNIPIGGIPRPPKASIALKRN